MSASGDRGAILEALDALLLVEEERVRSGRSACEAIEVERGALLARLASGEPSKEPALVARAEQLSRRTRALIDVWRARREEILASLEELREGRRLIDAVRSATGSSGAIDVKR